ncbi:MAG: YCF48-related protein [Pyrinomonadaceae bacterium]
MRLVNHSDLTARTRRGYYAGLPANLLNRYWWDVAFINSSLGFAVGDNSAFAVTYDGGTTWSERKMNTSDHLRVIRHNGRIVLVLGSQNVYKVDWKS